MTDDEVLRELGSGSRLDKARQVFRFAAARLETKSAQRRPPSALEQRRMEFEAVKEIIRTYGFDIK